MVPLASEGVLGRVQAGEANVLGVRVTRPRSMGAGTAAFLATSMVEPRPVPWGVEASARPTAMARAEPPVLIEDPASIILPFSSGSVAEVMVMAGRAARQIVVGPVAPVRQGRDRACLPATRVVILLSRPRRVVQTQSPFRAPRKASAVARQVVPAADLVALEGLPSSDTPTVVPTDRQVASAGGSMAVQDTATAVPDAATVVPTDRPKAGAEEPVAF